MAFARGRQAAEETAKNECLRRWPHIPLRCKSVYWNGHREGFLVVREDTGRTVGRAKSASDAWADALGFLEN